MKLIQITLLVFSVNLFAFSDAAWEGKDLYIEADCQKCHNMDKKFDPKKHKTKNISDLDNWVTSCAVFFKVQWFPEEEEQVVKYLNEVYYNLEK